MNIFDNAMEKLTETKDKVKINNNINMKQKEIEEELGKLGAEFFYDYKDNPPEEYKERIIKIINIQNEVAEAQAYLQKLSEETVCRNCGKTLKKDAKFCIYCGTAVEEKKEQPVVEKQTVNTCQKCGNPLDEEAAFCVNCGAPVEVRDIKTESEEDLSNVSQELVCQNCGKIFEEDENFCTNCGAPVSRDN